MIWIMNTAYVCACVLIAAVTLGLIVIVGPILCAVAEKWID